MNDAREVGSTAARTPATGVTFTCNSALLERAGSALNDELTILQFVLEYDLNAAEMIVVRRSFRRAASLVRILLESARARGAGAE